MTLYLTRDIEHRIFINQSPSFSLRLYRCFLHRITSDVCEIYYSKTSEGGTCDRKWICDWHLGRSLCSSYYQNQDKCIVLVDFRYKTYVSISLRNCICFQCVAFGKNVIFHLDCLIIVCACLYRCHHLERCAFSKSSLTEKTCEKRVRQCS